jgi:tRNA(Ile)-lysidine synthetase-like protein
VATATLVQEGSAPLDRFRRDLDSLIAADAPIGLAVSGGPDSIALLLLAAEARPLKVEAASVDHALRPESRAEVEMVASLCERLGVPHTILTCDWDGIPLTAIQERARIMRYRLLGDWARERGLPALVTAHHLDDQAETLLMRLGRGAGVKDGALHWATDLEWKRAVRQADGQLVYKPTDAPREIRRRIIRRAILMLATEGGGAEPRGRELDKVLAALRTGRQATLRGVLCVGGPEWRFSRAPARKG